MCESRAVLATAEGEQQVMDDVTTLCPEGDGYRLVNLFGEQTHIRAQIREIDFLKHRIVFEQTS